MLKLINALFQTVTYLFLNFLALTSGISQGPIIGSIVGGSLCWWHTIVLPLLSYRIWWVLVLSKMQWCSPETNRRNEMSTGVGQKRPEEVG